MFDFAGSEFALIAVVALILIGPKDLPIAIKAITNMIKKARRMASEFQVHVDEMVREADLQDVRTGLNDLRRMDIKNKILNAVDSDGALRKVAAEPIIPTPAWTPSALSADVTVPGMATETVSIAPTPSYTIASPVAAETAPGVPAFIPPRAATLAPAFVPPGARA